MTRERAIAELRRLAGGLQADQAGAARFMERISERDDAEDLRAALVEEGARAVLEQSIVARGDRLRQAVAKQLERVGA